MLSNRSGSSDPYLPQKRDVCIHKPALQSYINEQQKKQKKVLRLPIFGQYVNIYVTRKKAKQTYKRNLEFVLRQKVDTLLKLK